MSGFYTDAQSIFETAQAGDGNADFALMMRADGGLHLIMESPVSLEGALAYTGASAGYHVSRSSGVLRVTGHSQGRSCVLETVNASERARDFLRDRPMYLAAANLPALTAGRG